MSPQFVLKHEALAHLREVALFPNTLNPHEAESLALVAAMVDQVMELHPGARWLHVGCDEVGASPLQQKNSARVERGRPAGRGDVPADGGPAGPSRAQGARAPMGLDAGQQPAAWWRHLRVLGPAWPGAWGGDFLPAAQVRLWKQCFGAVTHQLEGRPGGGAGGASVLEKPHFKISFARAR